MVIQAMPSSAPRISLAQRVYCSVKISLALTAYILGLLLAAASDISAQQTYEPPNSSQEQIMGPKRRPDSKPVCHDSLRYRVVSVLRDEEVGTDFLIKYKTSASPKPKCEYLASPGDFELPSEWAAYFLGLQGDLLILDSGTAPDPRGLIIWDLKKRERVYQGTYAEHKLHKGYMEFWLETGAATPENCHEYQRYQASGFGAAIDTWVRLDFASLQIKRSSKKRCSLRQ